MSNFFDYSKIDDSYLEFIEQEKTKEYFKNLEIFLENEYREKTIFPLKEDIFNVLQINVFDIKCIILGQDPYINDKQAIGYSFAVGGGKIPPSVKNIYKELENEYGVNNVDLQEFVKLNHLIKQGVFLLNVILTVEKGKSLSHKNIGWEYFTNNLLEYICKNNSNIVCLLFGNEAKSYKNKLSSYGFYTLETSHPSPFSVNRGFFGSDIFKKANLFLENNNRKGIDWLNVR